MKPPLETQLRILDEAIDSFLMMPENEERFAALDWVMKVASAKWDAYAAERRICQSEK
jgi:hypothetical protein